MVAIFFMLQYVLEYHNKVRRLLLVDAGPRVPLRLLF